MSRILFVFISFTFAVNWSSAQFSVGHATITFNDPTRTGGFGTGGGSGRQIQTEIYYPATTAGDNMPVASGTFPVIVFGHGFAMSWDAYQNIWEHYAPKGYILAFPRTESGLFPAPSHQDFGLDLKIVGQKLIALNTSSTSLFFQKILSNIGIIGHSMGGGASILAASGNNAIRTVVGLAPAETNPSAIAASSAVSVPALIFSGSQDGVTPPNDHHLPIFNNLGSGCKTFASIIGGAHCYFANSNFNCDFGEATSSSGISISRSEQHQRTYNLLDPWLAFMLKDSCDAYVTFMNKLDDLTSQIAVNSTCSINPIPNIQFSNGLLSASVSGFQYQWTLNGQPISGAINQDYQPLTSGQYVVEVIFYNGCSEISAPFDLNGLDVELNDLNAIVLYPNPAQDKLFIDNLNTNNLSYSIFSQDGVKCNTGLYNEGIDISDLISGIYFLELNEHFFKFVKQKQQ
jgi:predicted dienelactone hydrolase